MNLLDTPDSRAAASTIEQIAAEAPREYETVMASVPMLPGWVRLLIVVSASVILWAVIVIAVKALLR